MSDRVSKQRYCREICENTCDKQMAGLMAEVVSASMLEQLSEHVPDLMREHMSEVHATRYVRVRLRLDGSTKLSQSQHTKLSQGCQTTFQNTPGLAFLLDDVSEDIPGLMQQIEDCVSKHRTCHVMHPSIYVPCLRPPFRVGITPK